MTLPRRKLDRYELIAEIASGGMGTVVLARVAGAGGFQRLFAIKMMHPHLVEDAQFVAMLLDEARVAARIHHPNVVATVDICASPVGYYLVMDYVDGFTLTDVLDTPALAPKNRLRIANRILLDAMAGLEAAHNLASDDGGPLGIVHRDVSPHNILIGLDGVGRITDFGIALAASRITSSRPGIIKGKPAYMAPEQARGESLDRRADLWALGVMLWESLTDRQLFAADSDAATVLRVVNSPIPRPSTINPNVPPELEAVCLRALERDAGLRYRSAREMAGELERAAKKHDLVADSHEVADKMREVFAVQIDERRGAIRKHVSAMGPESAPMAASDIYHLPKLQQTPLPGGVFAPTLERAPSDLPPQTTPPPAAPGSTPHPATRVAGTQMDTATTGPGARPRPLVYAVAGLVLLVVLATVFLTSGSPQADSPHPRSAVPVTSAPASAAPETAAPETAAPEPASASTAPETAEDPSTADGTTNRRRRRTDDEGGDVPVEENPYRHR